MAFGSVGFLASCRRRCSCPLPCLGSGLVASSCAVRPLRSPCLPSVVGGRRCAVASLGRLSVVGVRLAVRFRFRFARRFSFALRVGCPSCRRRPPFGCGSLFLGVGFSAHFVALRGLRPPQQLQYDNKPIKKENYK